MSIFLGLLLVLIAGLLVGSFLIPGEKMQGWQWEHMWAVFSLFGMLAVNCAFACIFIPHITSFYAGLSHHEMMTLIAFGAAWGVGAILFGIGMDKLGLALGYPVIMGLNASLGTLIPLFVLFPEQAHSYKGLATIAASVIAVTGIWVCSTAGARKDGASLQQRTSASPRFAYGIIIAVLAGMTAGLPNIGLAFSQSILQKALAFGIPSALTGDVVWVIFFAIGSLVNLAYALILVTRRRTWPAFWAPLAGRNFLFGFAMSLVWVSSLYVFNWSSSYLGPWGPVLGWPLYVITSILAGVLWGWKRGEWKGATAPTKRFFAKGLALLALAILSFAGVNLL